MTARQQRVAGVCEACGTEVHDQGEESWQRATYLNLPLAPGVTAKCCSVASRAPKGICARRIRQRRQLCPGCGAKGHGDMVYLGTVCERCLEAIARDGIASAETPEPYRVLSGRIFPFIDSDAALSLGQHLARALAAGRRVWIDHVADKLRFGVPSVTAAVPSPHRSSEGGSDDPIVELTEVQAAAIDALAEGIGAALGKAHDAGFRAGNDLLHRLAKGDVKPDDYEQWGPRGQGRSR